MTERTAKHKDLEAAGAALFKAVRAKPKIRRKARCQCGRELETYEDGTAQTCRECEPGGDAA
jgi:hypothetical protein